MTASKRYADDYRERNVTELAEASFNAYNEHGVTPWLTFDGRPVPRWHELNDAVRAKWKAAVREAISRIAPPLYRIDADGKVTLVEEPMPAGIADVADLDPAMAPHRYEVGPVDPRAESAMNDAVRVLLNNGLPDWLAFQRVAGPGAGDVHVLPNLPEDHPGAHRDSGECWCSPKLEADYTKQGGSRLWVHQDHLWRPA